MDNNPPNHVFISYVREDVEKIDEMAATFKNHGVEVWLDREKILPGARWQAAIRRAIHSGAFFIACFSENYVARDITYMNEELTIAIERLRQTSRKRNWFIPVLLTDCEPPDLSIGGGETVRDLQWVDLQRNWDSGIKDILKVLVRGNHTGHKEESLISDSTLVHSSSQISEKVPQTHSLNTEALVDDETKLRWRFGKGACSNCAYPLGESEAVFEQGVGYVHPYDCLGN